MTTPSDQTEALRAALRELRWFHNRGHAEAEFEDCEVCGIIRGGFATPAPSVEADTAWGDREDSDAGGYLVPESYPWNRVVVITPSDHIELRAEADAACGRLEAAVASATRPNRTAPESTVRIATYDAVAIIAAHEAAIRGAAPLDVERLATVLRRSLDLRAITRQYGRFNDVWYDRLAAAIAAEYSAMREAVDA